MDFARFFEVVHGHAPFPWQREMARRLLADEPLSTVAVPTGCGKTALVDAALFAAAHGGRRRIFFIVDRRVVVDEAHRRAERLRRALAEDPELQPLAERLGPVAVVRLRGGVHLDQDWVWYPERTTVVLSTVDQVGSRLLFRGYGVSSRSWPLHAGFVGNGALYLVDEAHLSQPFLRTVEDAARLGADVRLIRLTATPPSTDEEATLRLREDDHRHPVLGPRLTARKLARLEVVGDSDRDLARAAADRALALAADGAKVVGVVLNTVRAAREAFEVLQRRHEAVLLTGRIRPLDRDRLLEVWLPRLRCGRDRSRDRTCFAVATQTIEVGADLDFDALVTEAASLSALRQRFGRLDRRGELVETRAWILARGKDLDPRKAGEAPVYGEDLARTWAWLQETADGGVVDLGIRGYESAAARVPPPPEREPFCPPLLPAHLDLFQQTGPLAPEIDPAPWLHGPGRGAPEVQVLWRADLDPERPEAWVERVRIQPPRLGEAVALPIGALRDVLAGRWRSPTTDAEGDVDPGSSKAPERDLLLWRGGDEGEVAVARLDQVRPGDTVVLPAAYGGCDDWGWLPGSGPVEDLAELAALEGDGPFVLRLDPRLRGLWRRTRPRGLDAADLDQALDRIQERAEDLRRAWMAVSAETDLDEEELEACWQALREAVEALPHPFVERLGETYHYRVLEDGGLVLVARALRDEGGTWQAGVPVPLEVHLDGVAEEAGRLADGEPHRAAVVEAARAHDLGKLAPAFQAMLHGDPVRAAEGEPLAKSGLTDGRAMREAARRAGLPRGFRHELHSLERLGDAPPLVRHLVGTHHGHGRPWFPACEDPKAPGAAQAEPAAGWPRAFLDLVGELGPWRLASLELLVRAADVRRSRAEQEAPSR